MKLNVWFKPALQGRTLIPYFVLAIGLMLTIGATYYAAMTAKAKDRLQFENAVGQATNDINKRLDTYIAQLLAGSGLFTANEQVSRDGFQAYVERLELQRYPGIQGMGFSARVKEEEKDALISRMQRQGMKNFTIRPDFKRQEYYPIVYLEPLNDPNQLALGFDMFSEPVRRQAMERARDTGVPAASGKVTLIQEIERQKQAGFLIYVPVYRQGIKPDTLARRQAALRGFVYSPFRVEDLLAGIFGIKKDSYINFEIYDGKDFRPENRLYQSNNQIANYQPRFKTTKNIDVAGRTWSIAFASQPELDRVSEKNLVPYFLMGGLLLTFVLFGVTRSQVLARETAETLAFELQNSEKALRASESRLRRLVDANIIGIIIGDTQSNVIEANDAFLKIIGYSREEFLSGKINWKEITPQEYHHLDQHGLEEMKETGSHIPYEKEFISKDGSRAPVLVGTALLEGSQDVGVGFILDLKEQKKAEKSLQQSETRLRTLIEQSPLSTQILSLDGRTIQVNKAWLELWGLTLDLISDYNILEDEQLVAKGIMPYIKKAFAGEATAIPPIMYDPNQSISAIPANEELKRWVQAFIYPVKDEAGNIREVVLLHEDITERKRAETAIQESNDRLELLAEISNSLLLDEQPIDFINSIFNQTAAHLKLEFYFNYLLDEEKQMLHLQSYQGISTELAAQIEWLPVDQSVCGNVAQVGHPIVAENLQQLRNTEHQLIYSLGINAYACYPLLNRDHLIGTIAFGSRDRATFDPNELALMQVVSEQVATALERSRLLKELQHQTEELQQANRLKDEFLATLSHELRTPLNSMVGWTTLLLNRKFDETIQKRALETIDRNTKSLAQLIEDVLDVSRIITGKLRLNVHPIKLIPVIEAAIETVRPAAEAKNIYIEAILDKSVGPVLGDSNRLQQVVWNLLSNGVKFTPKGGKVEVKLEISNSRVYIRVKDTGVGIRADFLPFVFERFRQADSSLTRSQGGLGLGLAIVRHLVELQGGSVYAESQGEGLGATFIVSLPLIAVRMPRATLQDQPQTFEDEDKEAAISPPSLEGLQVLVVDDEADTRFLLKAILEQYGAKVTTCATAAEAFKVIKQNNFEILNNSDLDNSYKKFQEQSDSLKLPSSLENKNQINCKFDVMVSDIGMPEEDGYTLIRKVRAMEADIGEHIPAVALTAYASLSDRTQALSAGFQIHIPKPVDAVELAVALGQLTGRVDSGQLTVDN